MASPPDLEFGVKPGARSAPLRVRSIELWTDCLQNPYT